MITTKQRTTSTNKATAICLKTCMQNKIEKKTKKKKKYAYRQRNQVTQYLAVTR